MKAALLVPFSLVYNRYPFSFFITFYSQRFKRLRHFPLHNTQFLMPHGPKTNHQRQLIQSTRDCYTNQRRRGEIRSLERWQSSVLSDLENHLVRNILVTRPQPDTDYHSQSFWPVDRLLWDQIIYLPGQPWGCPAPLNSNGAPCFRFELQGTGHKA